MNVTNFLAELKKFILIKSGLRTIDPAHCKVISEQIFAETKNYVSETTIKRIFGFANTLHQFSTFTLNSLSQYVGYVDWNAFCDAKQNEFYLPESLWDEIKLKIQSITESALIAKKNNLGIPTSSVAKRSFLYPDFDYFFKKEYIFTTLSALPRHGKTTFLVNMIEYFFLSRNSSNKDDIVLLFNSTLINSIILSGISFKEWFLRETKFASIGEVVTYFKNNKEKKKGNFVVIFDGIDEYLEEERFFKTLIDILYSIEENNFLKIILSLRTSNWIKISPYVSKSSFLTKYWYKGLFYDEEHLTNLPPLNHEEILFTLNQKFQKKLTINDIDPDLLNLFKTPFWLQEFYSFQNPQNFPALENPISSYELIHHFLERNIFLTKNSTEKIFLLKRISNEITEGNKKFRLGKEKVLDLINNNLSIYRELIISGILIEEKRYSTIVPTEIIRFLNDEIYTYFLFLQISEKFNYETSKALFEYIISTFNSNSKLRYYILNWAIRFSIIRNDINELVYILKLPFSSAEKNNVCNFICNVICYQLDNKSNNAAKLRIDGTLINLLVSGRTTGKSYKTTIKKLAEHAIDVDIQIMIYLIECLIYIFDVDKDNLQRTMQYLKQNYKRMAELFPINPYEIIYFFYGSLAGKDNDSKSIDSKINQLLIYLNTTQPLDNKQLAYSDFIFYRLVVLSLLSRKKYMESEEFIEALLKKYPKLLFMRHNSFSAFLVCNLGHSYVKTGKMKKAQRVISFLDNCVNNDNSYHTKFVLAAFSLLKVNYFNTSYQYQKAIEESEKGLKIAAKSDFKMIEITLTLAKIYALKHNEAPNEASETINELIHFLAELKISMPGYTNFNDDEFEQTFKLIKYHSKLTKF